MESAMETRMLKTLEELETKELRNFQWHLRQPENLEGLQPIPKSRMENASRTDTVDLIIQTYPSDATRIMINVLKKIVRNDLVVKAFPNPNPAGPFPNPHKAAVQVPDGSAVIGAGVPSLIPPVTMDTASEDSAGSAPPPAKKTAKRPAVGPMEEIRHFLPLVSVKPRTVVCESVNFEKQWECRVSVSLECFTFQDHRSFTSKKDASHSAYLTLGCAGQICQPDERKVKEKVNQHFSQRSFPLPKDVYKQPEPLKFCCSLTNITCVFTYTGTDSSEASARQAAFHTALSCLCPLVHCPTALPTTAKETELKLKTLLDKAAGLKMKGSDLKFGGYRSSAKLKFKGFRVESRGERGERSKKETQSRLSQRLLRLLQSPETPDTASRSTDQLSMRNALQEWFQQGGLGMPVFEDADGKFGTRITFSAPLYLYSDWQDSQEKAGKKLVEEIKKRFAFISDQ